MMKTASRGSDQSTNQLVLVDLTFEGLGRAVDAAQVEHGRDLAVLELREAVEQPRLLLALVLEHEAREGREVLAHLALRALRFLGDHHEARELVAVLLAPTPKANQQALVLHNSLRIRTAGESRRKSILMSVLEGGNHLSLLEHCHRSLVSFHFLEGVAHHRDQQVQPAQSPRSAEPTN